MPPELLQEILTTDSGFDSVKEVRRIDPSAFLQQD
jgi:hypothetical protein